jgi:hypothetical protein
MPLPGFGIAMFVSGYLLARVFAGVIVFFGLALFERVLVLSGSHVGWLRAALEGLDKEISHARERWDCALFYILFPDRLRQQSSSPKLIRISSASVFLFTTPWRQCPIHETRFASVCPRGKAARSFACLR